MSMSERQSKVVVPLSTEEKLEGTQYNVQWLPEMGESESLSELNILYSKDFLHCILMVVNDSLAYAYVCTCIYDNIKGVRVMM
jgi:hypothetical protein